MIERWIVLAGEEGGPYSNKMGGIWNVIDAEARTLARLASDGAIDSKIKILVLGPHYPTPGSDWKVPGRFELACGRNCAFPCYADGTSPRKIPARWLREIDLSIPHLSQL